MTIATLESRESVLAQAARVRAGVVLLDLDLGAAVGNGVDLIAPLNEMGSQVLVVTGSTDRVRHAACVEAGAAGFMEKSARFDELLHATLDAAHLQALLSPNQRQELLAELRQQRAEKRARLAAFEQLTPRESEVLAALCEGRSAQAIAAAAYVSEATVRTQIRGILTKLGVSSQLAAVAAARRAGWEPPTA